MSVITMKEFIVAVLPSLTSIVLAIGGWIFAWRITQDTKRTQRLEREVKDYLMEIRSRMDLEEVTNNEIAKQTGKTSIAIQRQMRDLTENDRGTRPSMNPERINRRIKRLG